MAYTRINWLRRIRQFANRITLSLVSGTTYDVTQVEGVVSQDGVPFSDTDMNKMDFALYLSHNTFVNTSGTDAYAINVEGLTSLTELIGIPLKFVTTVANTAACTLNVTSLGAKAITKDVTAALETGDILANSIVRVVYDGTQFQIMEQNGIVTKNGVQTLANKIMTAMKLATNGFIADANGNELIKARAVVASAVNEITVGNNTAGSAPYVEATGGDTNINLNLITKGTGKVQANGFSVLTGETASIDADYAMPSAAVQYYDVPGFSFNVVAGETYDIDLNMLTIHNSGTTDPVGSFYLSSGSGLLSGHSNLVAPPTGASYANLTAIGTVGLAGSTIPKTSENTSVTTILTAKAGFVCATSGVLKLAFTCPVIGTSTKIFAGGFMKVQKI